MQVQVIDQLRACDLFSSLPDATLRQLADNATTVHVTGGETLFRQGEPGDALYLVVLGRLCAVLEREDASPLRLGEIGPGQYVGEMALIASIPRGATIQALRDSVLIHISDQAFLQAVQNSPEAALAVARTVIHRSRPSPRANQASFRTLAVIPSGPATTERLRTLLVPLAEALSLLGTVDTLDAHGVQTLARETESYEQRLAEVQDRMESTNRFVLYAADNQDHGWQARCIRNGDRILVVTSSDGPPEELDATLRSLRNREQSMAEVDLVMLHPDGQIRPGQVGPWLDSGLLAHHYHVRKPDDVYRMARLMTGTGYGLSFSGGGFRSAACIGILRAYEEAGIVVDTISGTSGGAIVGALAAMENSIEEMEERFREVTALNIFGDAGPPFVSMLSGRIISESLQENFYGADTLIEDLPLPFQAACTNLVTGRIYVPRRGALWRAIRASTSLPGVFPPVPFGDALLVDGGLVNNLPVDLIRARCSTVIGCDVSEAGNLEVPPQEAYVVSGWARLWRKLNPFAPRETSQVASLGTTVVRSAMAGAQDHRDRMDAVADAMLIPPVSHMGLLDTHPATCEQLFRLGYEAGRAFLQTETEEKTDTLPV